MQVPGANAGTVRVTAHADLGLELQRLKAAGRLEEGEMCQRKRLVGGSKQPSAAWCPRFPHYISF